MQIEVYKEKEIEDLSSDLLINLAYCYKKVFNYFWQDNWTKKTALEKVKSGLAITDKRKPILSLMFDQGRVVGFAWIILTTLEAITKEDMPFDITDKEKEYGVRVVKYWLKIARHNKVAIYRELGIEKNYQNWQGVHMASHLNLLIARGALEVGYNLLIYWTNPRAATFKQCIRLGWHPIHFFIDHDSVIMKGDAISLIEYSKAFLNKDRQVFKRMNRNKKKYLCR